MTMPPGADVFHHHDNQKHTSTHGVPLTCDLELLSWNSQTEILQNHPPTPQIPSTHLEFTLMIIWN